LAGWRSAIHKSGSTTEMDVGLWTPWWFLAIFGGMTVVHLGGQTDLLGAGTFWLVNVAARWFLR
jgi:hypothetical protein